MTEEICEEFRYSDVLQDPLIRQQIIVECQRHTKNSNQNQLVVAVYTKDRALDVTVALAKYFMYESQRGTALNKLNRTTTSVMVSRHTEVRFIPPRSKCL